MRRISTIKITNGKFPDYDQKKFVSKDIFIRNGKIEEIGSVFKDADRVIDASGKVISPGFIDIHMHEESLEKENNAYDISNYMLSMGVTTCAGGNCGLLMTPIKRFMDFVDKNGAPVNYVMFIGYNNLREEAGFLDGYSAISKGAVGKIRKLIERDLSYGAVGMSFGIEYSPGITFEEMMDAAEAIPGDDYLLSAHYRYDDSRAKEAIEEMIEIGRRSGLPFQISHLGSAAASGYMKECLDTIRKARSEQIDIMADCYPYDAFCTMLGSAIFDDGFLERFGKDYKDLLLTNDPYKNVRCTEEIFKKVRVEHPDMLTVAFFMNESEVIDALREPFVMVASDGLYSKGQGHPRGAGSFPRVLGNYVREKNQLGLLEALEKMTKMPAQRLHLFNKGEIKVGSDADITIFDSRTILDGASFERPVLRPSGIEYVIIDGKIAMENGVVVNDRLGSIIKR